MRENDADILKELTLTTTSKMMRGIMEIFCMPMIHTPLPSIYDIRLLHFRYREKVRTTE